jgi:ATP sulfurylase
MKNNKTKELLSTLGPSSLNRHVISRLTDLGVNLFRINLSHTSVDELPKVIELIKSYTSVPICLDTEGAQIRTGRLNNKLVVEKNEHLLIKREVGTGNSKWFNLYPEAVYDNLDVGDILNIDFNAVMIQVIEKNSTEAVIRIITGGLMQQNKAVTLNKDIGLSPLTEKDLESLNIGANYNIKYFALSFANTENDVRYLRSIVGTEPKIISKIESILGLKNLEAISNQSDAILIDRGDLSREIPIENIPSAQKYIIKTVKEGNNKVYVATNFLESMITSVGPTRAELNDIHNTLVDGADGLVLAAETAIGDYPIQCATMMKKMIIQFESSTYQRENRIKDLVRKESLILPRPHGGELVYQVIEPSKDLNIDNYKILKVDLTTLMDAEQIAIGTFSPLTGFMNKKEIESVLDNYKLTNGIIWPLPIFCQISAENFFEIKKGETVILKLNDLNEPFVKMEIDDMFKLNLNETSKKMFGTNDDHHPGVASLLSKGNCFISGKVELIRRIPSKYKYYEITPSESRQILENKGWCRVAGFHTRNIPHRIHEYIQTYVLDNYFCDGLFIHPVVGPKKNGDYMPEIIIESYQILIDHYLKEKSLLGAFQSYSRYAGPREAVFTALCRKNFGCSHFIVGRDHTGVGDYYSKKDFENLFSLLEEDLGIIPIILDEFVYSEENGDYIRISDAKNKKIKSITGTKARKMLKYGEIPPSWYMREEISNYVIDAINNGKEVFV